MIVDLCAPIVGRRCCRWRRLPAIIVRFACGRSTLTIIPVTEKTPVAHQWSLYLRRLIPKRASLSYTNVPNAEKLNEIARHTKQAFSLITECFWSSLLRGKEDKEKRTNFRPFFYCLFVDCFFCCFFRFLGYYLVGGFQSIPFFLCVSFWSAYKFK